MVPEWTADACRFSERDFEIFLVERTCDILRGSDCHDGLPP